MTRAEAMLILQAHRPGADAADEPFFAEALALMQNDPVLGEWWRNQRAFDEQVAARLGSVPVPPHLREVLLTSPKIIPFRPALSFWMSTAAAALILALGVIHFYPLLAGPMDRDAYTAQVLPYVEKNPDFDLTDDQQARVMAWLREHHAPMGPIPPGMTGLTTLGCERIAVRGHQVSLVCFKVDGTEMHLFAVEQGALRNPPGGSPEYGRQGDWSTAAWSDGGISYVLATHAGPEMLKKYL